MRILVTGAAGGIGGRLVRSLLADGHRVVALDNLSSGKRDSIPLSSTCQFHEIDLGLNSDELLDRIGRVDSVLHLAGISSLAEVQKNPAVGFSSNVLSTIRVAEFCRKTGAGLVFSSTSAVYEGLENPEFHEELPLSPQLAYPVTKLMAEDILTMYHKTYGLPSVVLRFFNVFGEDQDIARPQPPFVNYLAREVSAGRKPTVYAPLSQARDYVYVDDVIEAIKGAMVYNLRGFADTFNVCSSVAISVQDILTAFSKGADVPSNFFEQGLPENFWDGYSELYGGSFPLHPSIVQREVLKKSVGSYLKIQEKLAWKPRSNVLEAIEKYGERLRESRENLA